MTKKKRKQIELVIIGGLAFLLIVFFALYFYRRQHLIVIDKQYDKIQEKATLTSESNGKLYSQLSTTNGKQYQNGQTVTVLRYLTVHQKKKSFLMAKVKLNQKVYYIKSRYVIPNSTNAINTYLKAEAFPHTSISKDWYQKFKKEAYKTSDGKPAGVVVHDTGTDGSTLDSEINFMEKDYSNSGVFVHTFISQDNIKNIAPISYEAQGVGPKGNVKFVQFELVHVYSKKDFALQLGNAAYYTAYVLKKYHLPVQLGKKDGSGTLWSHDMVSKYLGGTDHIDPTDYWTDRATRYFGDDYTMKDFALLVQSYYNRL